MDPRLRQRVRDRARNRCEYCHLPQSAIRVQLQVEHIIALQHRGASVEENLALACDRCNLHKGTNLSAIDPATDQVVRLFHPRTDDWEAHFLPVGAEIVGQTPEGRATVRLLEFNTTQRLQLREDLIAVGEW
jgi:hypothetical protein